jgi:hypothetical protein
MLDQSQRRRQGMVIRSRSKTTSIVPRESTYFPVDTGTGGIGESPRSSFSAHRYSQERSAVGRILSLSNNAWASEPPKPPPKPLLPPKPNFTPSTSHPIRVAVQSPSPKKPQESSGALDSQYMVVILLFDHARADLSLGRSFHADQAHPASSPICNSQGYCTTNSTRNPSTKETGSLYICSKPA